MGLGICSLVLRTGVVRKVNRDLGPVRGHPPG